MPLHPAGRLQFIVEFGCQLTVALQPAALNHYTSYYIQDCPMAASIDRTCAHNEDPDGVPIGPRAQSGWLNVAPQGFRWATAHCRPQLEAGSVGPLCASWPSGQASIL